MTTAQCKVDYLEICQPGQALLHVGHQCLGQITMGTLGDQGLLLATQSVARSWLRRGVPILDEHDWCQVPVESGFYLLNSHDQEFIFNSRAALRAFLDLSASRV